MTCAVVAEGTDSDFLSYTAVIILSMHTLRHYLPEVRILCSGSNSFVHIPLSIIFDILNLEVAPVLDLETIEFSSEFNVFQKDAAD